jgi:hypothetical protein
MAHQSKSAAIHSRLKHPVIDSDGHWIEYEPAVVDYVAKVGGRDLAERFKAQDILSIGGWAKYSSVERLNRRMMVGAWWGCPHATFSIAPPRWRLNSCISVWATSGSTTR